MNYYLKNLAITLIISIANQVYCQEIKKDDLLKRIGEISTTVFGGKPISQYALKNSAALIKLVDDIGTFVTDKSSKDKPLINALPIIKKESSNLLNTTNALSKMHASQKRDLSTERLLFKEYASEIEKLTAVKTLLNKETYVLTGKRDSRAIIIAYSDALVQLAKEAYKIHDDQEKKNAEFGKKADNVIAFLNAAQGKVFETSRVFKTLTTAAERDERNKGISQWNEAIRLVDLYNKDNGFNDPILNASLLKLKELADKLINTTKIINNTVFSKPNVISGSVTDRALARDYTFIEEQSRTLGKEIASKVFYNPIYKQYTQKLLVIFALVIEETAKKLPKVFNEEIAKRSKK